MATVRLRVPTRPLSRFSRTALFHRNTLESYTLEREREREREPREDSSPRFLCAKGDSRRQIAACRAVEVRDGDEEEDEHEEADDGGDDRHEDDDDGDEYGHGFVAVRVRADATRGEKRRDDPARVQLRALSRAHLKELTWFCPRFYRHTQTMGRLECAGRRNEAEEAGEEAEDEAETEHARVDGRRERFGRRRSLEDLDERLHADLPEVDIGLWSRFSFRVAAMERLGVAPRGGRLVLLLRATTGTRARPREAAPRFGVERVRVGAGIAALGVKDL